MCCWRKKRVKKKDENTAPTNQATQPAAAAPAAAATAPSASAKKSQAKPADGKQLQPTPSDTYKRALHDAGKCSADPPQVKAKPKEAEANKGKVTKRRLPTKRTQSVDAVIYRVPKLNENIRHGPLVGPTPPALPPPGPQPAEAAPKCGVRVQSKSTATLADATQPSTTTEVDPRKNSATDVSGKELEDEKTEETIQAAVIPSAPNTYAHASEPHFREVAVDRLPVQEHDEDRILRPTGPAVNLDMRPAAANQSTLEEVDGDMESQDFEDAEPVSDRSAFRR
ncbi:hypothetical protein AAVH_34655 [Aphelenchoides avenae]|nr:hypothetical protein AAVH_34655 [Aphelenchus avenae]